MLTGSQWIRDLGQSPLRASPQGVSRRDPALDGLRGVALLLVFLFHYGGGLRSQNLLARALGYLTQAGWIGVELFFVLSGFLITGLLVPDVQTPGEMRNFYARRALRILPLYAAALLAAAAAALLSGARVQQLAPLLVYAGFAQNWPSLLGTALHTPPPLPLYHLWSLAVEEQFYLLWPLVVRAARTPRRVLFVCLLIFALSWLFRVIVFAPHGLPDSSAERFAVCLPTRAGALALGSALAFWRPSPARSHLASLSPTLLAGGAALTGFLLTSLHARTLLLSNRPAFLLGLPAVDLLCAAVLMLSLQPSALRAFLHWPALRFLGQVSYGFYVLHILLEPVFDFFGALLTQRHAGFFYQTARLLTAFSITLCAAWLSFTLLERPFLRLKRFVPRTPTRAA